MTPHGPMPGGGRRGQGIPTPPSPAQAGRRGPGAAAHAARWLRMPVLAAWLGWLAGAGCGGPQAPRPSAAARGGVTVIGVAPGSALARAGLLAGDRVLRWSRGGPPSPPPAPSAAPAPPAALSPPAALAPHAALPPKAALAAKAALASQEAPAAPDGLAADVASVFDWQWVAVEQAPRGAVRLDVERQGRLLWLVVPPGPWEAQVQPAMPPALADEVRRVTELAVLPPAAGSAGLAVPPAARAAGLTAAAAAPARPAATGSTSPAAPGSAKLAAAAAAATWARLAASPAPAARQSVELRCWLMLRQACAWVEAGDNGRARDAAAAALALARGPRAAVAVWRAVEQAQAARFDWAQAAAPAADELRVADAAWGESLEAARAHCDLGAVAAGQGQTVRAEEEWQRCLELRERLAPGSVELAEVTGRLAGPALARGDLDAVERRARRALDLLRGQGAPQLEAYPLMMLSSAARERGDLLAAESLLGRAIVQHPESAPDLTTAEILNRLGMVARRRGDLALARRRFDRALALWDRFAPDDLARTNVLMNLGMLASDQGDLATARNRMQAVLAVRERLQPASAPLANNLDQLGLIAEEQGDLDFAERCFGRELAILDVLAPASPNTAIALGNLGELALRRGDPGRAAALCTRALAIQDAATPGNPSLAGNLEILAEAELARNELARAWAAASRALSLLERSGQDDASRSHASVLMVLGEVARQRGSSGRAAALYERALGIQERRGFGGCEVADSLHALGLLHRGGRPAAAARYFDRALAMLEDQVRHLSGSRELQAAYRSRHQPFYRDAIQLAVARGRAEEGLALLERSRGQGLLAQIAERDLEFPLDVAAPLRQEEIRAGQELERAEQLLLQVDARGDEAEAARQRRRLAELRRRHDESVDRIRQASPRFAALAYPRPLDLAGVRTALDPGTVMLSYSLGEPQSLLFVVSQGAPLEVKRLPIGEADLRRRVADLRAMIDETRGSSALARNRRRALEHAARSLYDLLLRPAAARIVPARRLLLVPDGALHLLPWGALIRDAPERPAPAAERPVQARSAAAPSVPDHPAPERTWQFVAEWKPLQISLSATVYDQLRRRRVHAAPGGAAPATALVAFADPREPAWLQGPAGAWTDPGRRAAAGPASQGLLSAALRGSAFGPLPFARLEVERIAHLFPGAARTFVGAEATEERAKALAAQARYLHFATHTTLDEASPLDSAVVLAVPDRLVPGRENGLLQAWEIFASLRLDADLVVLSGCESGLGKEMEGEGLLGLTRAFQYAGAQAVLASLWKVSDRMTEPLMVRFYSALRAGKPRDEALRQAQVELLAGAAGNPGAAGGGGGAGAELAPFFWAGFELFGDS